MSAQSAFFLLFVGLWLAWGALWLGLSWNVKAVAERESAGSRLAHILPLIVSAWLLADRHTPLGPLNDRFVPYAYWPPTVGVVLTAAGLLFAIWARLTLGGNWSGIVTLKKDHELIIRGPYRWVRHPIYTGLLLALKIGRA